MTTIECPRCSARIAPEEVSAGISLVCPDCDETDPDQASSVEPGEDEQAVLPERPLPPA